MQLAELGIHLRRTVGRLSAEADINLMLRNRQLLKAHRTLVSDHVKTLTLQNFQVLVVV